jgi:hypothetical protein
MGRIEKYRSHAARALAMAAECDSPHDKALLLSLAQGWLELAAMQWGPDVEPDDAERPSESPRPVESFH